MQACWNLTRLLLLRSSCLQILFFVLLADITFEALTELKIQDDTLSGL